MINFRLLEPTIRVNQKQNDWFLTSPEECDFAFRVWGGSWETFLGVYDSDKLEFAKRLSEHSFIFIKTIAPHAKHVMKNFDRVRMNNSRIGSQNNVGGNVYSVKDVEEEYIRRCKELGFSCKIVDITEEM